MLISGVTARGTANELLRASKTVFTKAEARRLGGGSRTEPPQPSRFWHLDFHVPQPGPGRLHPVILQDLMDVRCKTVLLNRIVLDIVKNASKVMSFPKGETVFTVTVVSKS